MSAALLLGLKKIGGWLASLPMYVWVIFFLALTLINVGNKYETSKQLAADRLVIINNLKEAAEKTTEKAVEIRNVEVVKYVDRVKVVREKASVIEKQVPIYLPAGTADFPGGFRLLHDAAAANSPIAEGVTADDAAPVPAEDAARTVAENYAQCNADKELILLWQTYYQRLCDTYGCK